MAWWEPLLVCPTSIGKAPSSKGLSKAAMPMIHQLREFIRGNTEVDLYNNYILEVAVRLLEAWKAGLDIEELRPDIVALDAKLRNGSITKRSEFNPMQDSHDNWLGWLIIDALYKLGIAQELIGHKGLWKTGKPHGVLWGVPVDSEWLTSYRPEYVGMARFVLGTESAIDRFFVHANLLLATTWNLLRARLLLLEYLGVGDLDMYYRRLGDRYKTRYGDEPIITGLWSMQ